MIHGVKDKPVGEYFTVSDAAGNLISGIDTTSFTVYLYDPTGVNVAGTKSDFFIDLGNGSYKYNFTPDKNGVWYVNVTQATYFPWGKTDDIYVDDTDLSGIYEIVRRTLGLVHHNFFIDQPLYGDGGSLISARVRIYDNESDVGTNNGVVETYKIEADEIACGQFSFWSQIKI